MPGGSKGGGGGKGGGSTTTQNSDQQRTNFAPFQTGAISRVFDILEGGGGEEILLGGTGRDSLLEIPETVSNALGNALGFSESLLGSDNAPFKDLLNFQSLINDELGKNFESTISDVSGLRDAIETGFNPLVGRATALADEGINPRFGNILERIANEDPFSNPFVDRLVGDVSTDVSNAVKDQFLAAGGLEASAAPQAIARETGRASTAIRGEFGERSRDRSLTAAQAGGQFDAANASQRLNALIGGSNILSSSFGLQLGAQNQINQLTQADAQRRLNLIGQRGQNELALANLPLQGLNAIGPLASQFAELPFVPLANFAEIAFNPLGSRTITDTTREIEEDSGLGGILDTVGKGFSLAGSLGLGGGGGFLSPLTGSSPLSVGPGLNLFG